MALEAPERGSDCRLHRARCTVAGRFEHLARRSWTAWGTEPLRQALWGRMELPHRYERSRCGDSRPGTMVLWRVPEVGAKGARPWRLLVVPVLAREAATRSPTQGHSPIPSWVVAAPPSVAMAAGRCFSADIRGKHRRNNLLRCKNLGEHDIRADTFGDNVLGLHRGILGSLVRA